MPRKNEIVESGEPMTPADEQRERSQALQLGGQVLAVLGQPAGLLRVQVRRLWDQNFRANVLVGADSTRVTFAHSYFLVTDGAGNILAATPELRRVY
ncbi:MAG: hypothetical protein JNM56_21775 [Planctomycetia bacterium]|nr:hypothetical protein [Planctomycetia bacterium]